MSSSSVIRKSKVYLYTRPRVVSYDPRTWPYSSIGIRHWSLLFVFDDDTVRHVEGHDSNDKIRPYCHTERPTLEEWYEDHLGEVWTSPDAVCLTAQNNKLNYEKYDYYHNNCQDWVKMYAKQFDKENSTHISSKLENFQAIRQMPVIGRPLAETANVFKSLKNFVNLSSESSE